MKFIYTVLFVTMFLQINGQESANHGAPKFAPPDGRKLLIIGQDLGAIGGLISHQDGYVDSFTCHIPAGVTSYTSLPSLSGLTSLANWGSGDVRAQAYLEDETFDNSFIVIGLYLVGSLDGIIGGFTDSSIRDFATWVKGQDRPVFIRIGYEFEGPWNNYDPTKFKNAWKHIVHVFDEEEVRNAAYVWQSAGLNYNNIINWYPGDNYVNWVAYSQFDGTNMGQSIKNFAEEHDKPIMIAEATPRVDLQNGNADSHWNSWYRPLFDGIYANDRIKALAYINTDWDSQSMWNGQGWGDSRVQEVPFLKNKWETEVKTEPWITGTDSLMGIINYEDWLITSITKPNQNDLSNEILIKKMEGQIQLNRKDGKMINGIKVWGYLGRLLFYNNTPAFQYSISTNQFPQGAVILSIELENRIVTRKEIIIHNN